VRQAPAVAAFAAAVLAFAPSAEGADADRPRVAVSVSPARLALVAPGSRRIKLRNDGAERVAIDVTQRAVGPQTVAAWLHVVPGRVSLGSGDSATLTLLVSPPRGAEPGNHRALVLVTTRPLRGGPVSLRMRLGIRLAITVPGRIVRRVMLGSLRVHRRRNTQLLLVSVANRGNVTIQLRGHVTAWRIRRGHRPVRLRPLARPALLPGARAILTLRHRGRVRGLVTVVVQVRLGPEIRLAQRRYRLRL
jgi:hypothetical protein